jgi:putative MATE family efflux protein
MEVVSKENYLFKNKDLLQLILPLMVEQFLVVTIGLAGSIMVASVGESAVSAVSLVDSVNILLLNIFAALATGGAVVAGQYIGQKRNDMACKAGKQLVVFVTFISFIIMAFMYLGKGFILNVVFGDIDADVQVYANTYMTITFAGIPFIALYNSGAALFRTMGNSKITMIISLVINIINIVGSAICIYVLHLGVKGVAITALLSRILGAIMIIILLKDEKLKIHVNRFFIYKFDGKMVKNILYIGVPNGVENSMFQLGKIMLLSVVSSFGTASITANAVANTVGNFQMLPGIAISMSLITVVSQCVGAGDYAQVRYFTKKLLKYSYISLTIWNAAIILSLPLIIDIYHLSAETGSLVNKILIFHGINICITWPISFTLPNTLRASNDARYTMVVGVGSMWIFRIVCGIFLAKYMNIGVFGVWIAMIIDWFIRSILFEMRYKGHSWELAANL